MILYKKITVNPFGENTYLLWDETRPGVIVDPGCLAEEEIQELYGLIAVNGVIPKKILLTHGHFDHIYGVKKLAERLGATIFMHPADEELVRSGNAQLTGYYRIPAAPDDFEYQPIKEGDVIEFGESSLTVIETPGHTYGGVCFYSEPDKLLLSGDTLFAGTIGRTDSQWGDYDKLILNVMDKLMGLDSDVQILPGHGPSSSIGYERTHNPFLQPFNEPDGDIDNEDGLYIQGE